MNLEDCPADQCTERAGHRILRSEDEVARRNATRSATRLINPMHGTEKLPDLIQEIYDAALEPALWNDVVVSINDYVGGQACGIFSKDSADQSGLTHYHCGADPHCVQLYANTHSSFDPLTTFAALGKVESIPDLVSCDEYRSGRFYQEWLQPQGRVDAAKVVLEQSSRNCAV